MSNSSSSSSAMSNSQQMVCYCGHLVKESTAQTEFNYGRRFWGCPMYATKSKCNFFRWRDDEYSARDIYVIRKLLKEKKRVELENEKLQESVTLYQIQNEALKVKCQALMDNQKQPHKCSLIVVCVMCLFFVNVVLLMLLI